MSNTAPDRTQRNGGSLSSGNSHPVLASIAFFATFALTALPFVLEIDAPVFLGVCIVAAFSSAIMFLRLLIGNLGSVNYMFLAIASALAFTAGQHWYIPVTLACATIACSFIISLLIGDYSPLVRGVKLR